MIPVRVNNNNDVSATGSRYSLYKAYIGLLLLETGHIKLLANDGIAPHDAGIDIPTTCAGALQFTYTSAAPAGYVTTPYTLSFDSCSIHNVESLGAVLKIEADGFTFRSNQGLLPRGGQYSPALKYWNVTPPPAAPHPVRLLVFDLYDLVVEYSDGTIVSAIVQDGRHITADDEDQGRVPITIVNCQQVPKFDKLSSVQEGVVVDMSWLTCRTESSEYYGDIKVSVGGYQAVIEEVGGYPGRQMISLNNVELTPDE